MGARHATNVAFESPRSELVAICDENEKIRSWAVENLPSSTLYFSNFEECLAFPGLQAVIIATVTSMHSKIAVRALEMGLVGRNFYILYYLFKG